MPAFTKSIRRLALIVCATQLIVIVMPAPDVAAADGDSMLRQRTLLLVNNERAAHNLPPLTENSSLDTAAEAYAQLLSDDSCFGHSCGPDPDFVGRDTHAGYAPWSILGENVAAGQSTPDDVVHAWMDSPVHRENILRPEFKEVGLGVAHGGVHGTYWAEEFGARPLESLDNTE
jgi:uncharacterized protein YkwD